MAAVQEPSRVAFLGVHAWKAHEAVRWWGAAYSEGEQAVSEGAPTRLDVFGVARADVALPLACGLAWQGLRPGSDTRVASHPVVDAVVCSGVGPNDVQVVKDSRRAGKAMFVESLERFQPADLAELAATAGEGEGPQLMSGLYLRFDSALQEAAQLGLGSVVGRPLLFQAHATTLAPSLADTGGASAGGIPWFSRSHPSPVVPSLFELGMQQVDALRFLLKAEPTEVFAAGTAAAGSEGGVLDFGSCEAVALTIKTSSGALAILSLDCAGGAARQRILVAGDQSRAEFVGGLAASELQTAGIRHFLDAATAGAPPRMAARDCLRAAAVMAAARESLRSGAPVPVSYDFAAAAAGTGAVAAAAAAGKVSSKLGNAAASMVDSAQQAVAGAGQGKGAESPAGKPHEEGVSTPPHQRTPPAKAGPSTPESPGLLTNLPPEDDYSS